MARKIFYKIIDEPSNKISDQEWDDVLRLQHWYNSEFIWTAGRLGFRMYAVFPNIDSNLIDFESLDKIIHERKKILRQNGLTENETIQILEAEGLVITQKGGYIDKSLASGFTRVACNEFNAYLVCEFLLKSSLILRNSTITVSDEGEFIKSKSVMFHQGNAILRKDNEKSGERLPEMILNRHIFAIVDPSKYNHHPDYRNTINNFSTLNQEEKESILTDWNWLGFAGNYDIHGDDVRGYDLNKKVRSFYLEIIK
ncbi:MAG: hypothetical protein C0417_06155 [Chlorobiaceae bacterium]|nr:hypothetical protein [Chlorobiaceae bacterium]